MLTIEYQDDDKVWHSYPLAIETLWEQLERGCYGHLKLRSRGINFAGK